MRVGNALLFSGELGGCGRELVKGLTLRPPEVTDRFLFLAPRPPEIML